MALSTEDRRKIWQVMELMDQVHKNQLPPISQDAKDARDKLEKVLERANYQSRVPSRF